MTNQNFNFKELYEEEINQIQLLEKELDELQKKKEILNKKQNDLNDNINKLKACLYDKMINTEKSEFINDMIIKQRHQKSLNNNVRRELNREKEDVSVKIRDIKRFLKEEKLIASIACMIEGDYK